MNDFDDSSLLIDEEWETEYEDFCHEQRLEDDEENWY